jgi:hypothetical protein
VLEKALSAVAAVAIPALGFALQASRRNRLRQRIAEYLQLADQVETHDAETATAFRRLASEAAHLLVTRDQRWMRRRIEPAAIVAILLLVIPAVVGGILALSWDSPWKWPAFLAATIWAVVWTGVGLTQIWQEREDVPADGSTDGENRSLTS